MPPAPPKESEVSSSMTSEWVILLSAVLFLSGKPVIMCCDTLFGDTFKLPNQSFIPPGFPQMQKVSSFDQMDSPNMSSIDKTSLLAGLQLNDGES